jgi:DNA-binding response OmpR family regulator
MKTILVIEDEHDSASVMVSTLKSAGYTVIVALTRDAGMVILKKQSCDGVLLDIYMPGMSAFNFLRELHLLHSPPPVVLVTCAYRPHEIAKTLGLDHCLAKPFSPDSLVGTMRMACPNTSHLN